MASAAKTLLIWRVGGIGDLIWCTAALPVLRKQGWVIDFCTDSRGEAVLAHNPHLRRVIPFDGERDPQGQPLRDPKNEQLLQGGPVSRWWAEISKRYDWAIPLTWSVEGVALWRIGDNAAEYHLPMAERQSDLNYTDEIVRRLCMPWLGGLLPQLWPSKPERRWLEDLRARHVARKQRILLWHIGGSTYHKIIPQAVQYIGGLLEQFPNLFIYLLGDERLVEFEKALSTLPEAIRPRWASVRGQWGLRQQILAPMVADCVVGPESAITNAASCWDVPKVVFFSHSRHENLSLYWWNVYPIYPTEKCECAPCYRIIEGEPESCRVYEADLGWTRDQRSEVRSQRSGPDL